MDRNTKETIWHSGQPRLNFILLKDVYDERIQKNRGKTM